MLDMNRLAHACILVVLASPLKKSDHLFIDDLLHTTFKRSNHSASGVEVIICILRADCCPSAQRAWPRTLARGHTTFVPDRLRTVRCRSCAAQAARPRRPDHPRPPRSRARRFACASGARGAAAGQHPRAARRMCAADAPTRPPCRRGDVCALRERAVRGRVRVSVVDGLHLASVPRSPMGTSPTTAVPCSAVLAVDLPALRARHFLKSPLDFEAPARGTV
jgi:hypothetical protein